MGSWKRKSTFEMNAESDSFGNRGMTLCAGESKESACKPLHWSVKYGTLGLIGGPVFKGGCVVFYHLGKYYTPMVQSQPQVPLVIDINCLSADLRSILYGRQHRD